MSAATRDPRTQKPGPDTDGGPGKHVVLILSSDAVAAALLGALVETLGYLVRFYRPPEPPEIALRRERPSIALIDCADPTCAPVAQCVAGDGPKLVTWKGVVNDRPVAP